MAEHAIHPPIHLVMHPDEPIRSLEAAAETVLRQIKSAKTLEQADAAGKAFRAWAEAEGLLLVPPEDGTRH